MPFPPETGRHRQPVDVGELIEGMARGLDSMVGKQATLRRNLAAALPCIEADSEQVRQVVINLTANAADALGDRSGDIGISTGVMWAEEGELPPLQAGRVLCAGLYVYIEVRDTGCGMDAGRRPDLAIVDIMRGHRGSIQVTGKVGEGTIFRVLFPANE
jgi:two-component system cell cycle sensor histidine kinase/response regulator CckA